MATVLVNDEEHKMEMARHNEEETYYEKNPENPLMPGSNFLVAIRCELEHLQISVTIGKRLVTWYVNKVPDSPIAKLTTSNELEVSKITYVVPQKYFIKSRLDNGVYGTTLAQKIFQDKCHNPREIHLQGTVPRHVHHLISILIFLIIILIFKYCSMEQAAIKFDIQVTESISGHSGEPVPSLEMKFNVGQLDSALEINNVMATKFKDVLRPGYDYTMSIIPKATHFEYKAGVLGKLVSGRIKYQTMDSLVNLLKINGVLLLSNFTVSNYIDNARQDIIHLCWLDYRTSRFPFYKQ